MINRNEMTRRDRYVTVDGIEIHYSEWGDPDGPCVLCVHGLSRVGRDFDALAASLADQYRIICPDMAGRGWSQWGDPDDAYSDEAMIETIVGLVATLELEELRYVGTSMGALLGMVLASGPLSDRITHLLINDASPNPEEHSDPEAIERIMTYVPDPPAVDTLLDLEEYYRELYEDRFSPMDADEWRRFTVTSARRTAEGNLTPAYDPRILDAADGEEDGPDPWDLWAAIEADLMIVRGRDSAILPPEPYERMLELQPGARTTEVDCGHAPALNVPDQLQPIREFFSTGRSG